MPTSLGTVTLAIVVGGAVDVVARVVATVGKEKLVAGAGVAWSGSLVGWSSREATTPKATSRAARMTYQRRHHGPLDDGPGGGGDPEPPGCWDGGCQPSAGPVGGRQPGFSSQAEAQTYFEANGGSPTNNVDNLDADHDGQACEDFDYGATGGGGTGGGGTGGDDGELPFTGPNDTLLPAGTALLVAGLALVGVTRYRARHARR